MNFNTKDYQKARQRLEKIRYLISTYVETNINIPLNAVADELSQRDEIEYSHERFHQTIAGYIQLVSEKTEIYGCKLGIRAAHSEAVFLIKHFYMGIHDNGMQGALIDALNPTRNPMTQVVFNLNKALKDYACQRHIQMVRYHYIDSAGWQMRYMMTVLVLEGGVQPGPPMDTWPTERLCGCLFGLIQSSLRTG